MNSKEFSLKIEEVVKEKKGMPYLDAILYYCDKNDIDPSTVAPMITKSLKDKLTLEAQNLNILPKTGRLPV